MSNGIDIFAPEGAFKAEADIRAVYYHIEPGDGTRYEFIVTPYRDGEYLYCLSTGEGASFSSALYRIDEVQKYIDEHPKWDYKDAGDTLGYDVDGGKSTFDRMVAYITSESACNPWTAVAALMAMNRYICSFHY